MTDMTKAPKGKMLPGIAGIGIFLLLMTLLNVFAALSSRFGAGAGRLSILALSTLLVAGILGLFKMRRWGHAIVLAGTLLLSAGYFYLFAHVHQLPLLLQGFFMLLFFLYLVRPEVRDRML
jgi:phosphoglycerol transferase MdoB-like AlkP superfamily enzyme